MKKKTRGLMLAFTVTIAAFAASINVSANPDSGENMALIFSDDFNDNYLDPENWVVHAIPDGTRVEETNGRLEIDIQHIIGQSGDGGVDLLRDFTGEGIFEVDMQNGFSYNYLYKFLQLRNDVYDYEVRLYFHDWGPITILMHTPEQTDPYWMITTLYDGDVRNWNWIFHLKLIRNSDGTFTGIVTDDYGHHFEGTTSLTAPLDIPLRVRLSAHKWYWGYPVMIFYDNFKAYGIPVEAVVDIDPDALNLRSEGEWITAYIELPEGYDVNDVDVSSILLDNTISVDPDGPVEIGDYDSDTILDLMVKFDREELTSYIYNVLEIEMGDVTLTVSGELYDGTLFEGSDTIRVIFAGDINGDGKINVIDLAILGRDYGSVMGEPSYHERADLNSDGTIDIEDIVITAINYLATTPE